LNSDARKYGGSHVGNLGGVDGTPTASHGWPYSLRLTLPPLAAVLFTSEVITPWGSE
jgi:1,4-alpha-glucan branching enzyme